MSLATKEDMERIRLEYLDYKKDPKNRALIVIQTLCGGDIEYADIEKFKTDIYKIAHSAIGNCPHADWVEETEKLFNAFEKGGLI